MGRIGGRGLLIGAALVAAIGVASASAIVFQGRDDAPAADSTERTSETTARHATTTTSSTNTSTTTTTTTNTTTDDPPPTTANPTPAPAPDPVMCAPLHPAPATVC